MILPVTYDHRPCYDIVCMLSGGHAEAPVTSFLKDLGFSGRRICVLSDENVMPLYGEALIGGLYELTDRVSSILLPSGEDHKHLGTVHKIYELLKQNRFDRKDLLIALGGGVVGDITGFAAATYLRGISFVQMPTTLLAQTDSSIGGKTGVDFEGGKNLIGAFYMPRLVYIDAAVLKTLPAREVHAGLAEVVKYGLIRDAAYYNRIWALLQGRTFHALLDADADAAVGLIIDACRFKKEIVEEDPKEEGVRAILNFGHTIGHAIESLSRFTLLHGECVAIGSVAAAYLSLQRRMITQEAYETLKERFAALQLPVNVDASALKLTQTDVIETMRSDKKADADTIRFILLDGIGNACIRRDVTKEELIGALYEIGITA